MILIDACVFVIDLRYQRDPLFGPNRAFLDAVAAAGRGALTLYTLMEVAGLLSFNLNARQLQNLLVHFAARYRVAVLPPADLSTTLPSATVQDLLARMQRKAALGDAMTMESAERVATPGATLVTWDADHFAGRTPLPVLTPSAWLDWRDT